jgi:hypothetical protein
MTRTLLDDPRHPDFVERYQADPLAFAIEVTGLDPSIDQMLLFDAMAADRASVSVVSGTSTGKTVAFSRIALWHLLCFPYAVVEGSLEIGSNTYIGAPVLQQVCDGVWKGLNDSLVNIKSGPHAWIADYFTITKTRVYVKGYEDQWFIAQLSLADGASVSIAGKHRAHQMVIVDEAAGVSDDHFRVIEGTQTQEWNKTLLASQGVKNVGFFYDTHHKLCKANGGSWVKLRFNSENSPFVTIEWLRNRELESGGRNTVEYQVRVLGLFAEDSSNNLLARADIEKAFRVKDIISKDEPWGILVLGDVALGEYRDDSVVVVAKVIGHADFGPEARRVEFIEVPVCSNSKNEIDLAGDMVDILGKQDNGTLYVDRGGVGATVCKLIDRSGAMVTGIDWGKPCFLTEHKNRFYNLRAAAQVRMRDAIKQGRVSLPENIDQRLREKIINQGSRLPYSFAEAGGLKYLMMKKEEMRKLGIKSPDIWDAMSFAFMPGVEYIVAAGSMGGEGHTGPIDAAVERMRARRAARETEPEEGDETEVEESA